jgi:hypothetical protein
LASTSNRIGSLRGSLRDGSRRRCALTRSRGCGGGGGSSAGSTTAQSTSTSSAVQSIDVKDAGAKIIELDGDWLVGTGDAVWINAGQLDLDSGEVTKTIEADMAGAGGSLTVADGSIWIRGTLTPLKQIDSDSGEIVAAYKPPTGGGDSLVQAGRLPLSAIH